MHDADHEIGDRGRGELGAPRVVGAREHAVDDAGVAVFACRDRARPAPMAAVDEVALLPDADQHKLLSATLERVNRASNAARAAALQANAFGGAGLRDIVKAEIERAKLPEGFVRPVTDRVERSLQRRAGKQQKFSTFQSLTLPPSALKWNTSDRV